LPRGFLSHTLAGTRKHCTTSPKTLPPDAIFKLKLHKNALVVKALSDVLLGERANGPRPPTNEGHGNGVRPPFGKVWLQAGVLPSVT